MTDSPGQRITKASEVWWNVRNPTLWLQVRAMLAKEIPRD